jgi:hypothetical protein
MQVQCVACKKYFDLADSSEEQGSSMLQEQLCNECLLAHIQMLVYGQSRKAKSEKKRTEYTPQQAA